MNAPLYGHTPVADKRIFDLRMDRNIDMWLSVQHYPAMMTDHGEAPAYYHIRVWTMDKSISKVAFEHAVRDAAVNILDYTANKCIEQLLGEL